MGTLRDLIAENDRLRDRAHAAEASARSARAEALEEVATWHEQRAKELVALAKTAGDDQGLFREAMHHRFSATAIRSLKTAPKDEGED